MLSKEYKKPIYRERQIYIFPLSFRCKLSVNDKLPWQGKIIVVMYNYDEKSPTKHSKNLAGGWKPNCPKMMAAILQIEEKETIYS